MLVSDYQFDYFNYSTNGPTVGVEAYKQQTLGPGGLIPASYCGTVAAPKLVIGAVILPLGGAVIPPGPGLLGRCMPPAHPDDCAALLALNNSVTMPGGALYGTEQTQVPVCEWLGVRCDASSGRVTELDLHNQGLRGVIPSAISRLGAVQKL